MKGIKYRTVPGFSLVEVVLAIGVVAFALMSIVALLPIGLKANKTSSDESRAANLLTAVDADLRTSIASGFSQIFQLPTPYKANPTPSVIFNALPSGTIYTKGIEDDEIPVTSSAGLRFQVSVVYTKIPAAGSLLPMEARLIVSWPCLPLASSTPENLTNPSLVAGFVESYVTFPAP